MEAAAENAGGTHCVRPARRKHEGAPGVARLPFPAPRSHRRGSETPLGQGWDQGSVAGLDFPRPARPRGTSLTFFARLGRPRQPPTHSSTHTHPKLWPQRRLHGTRAGPAPWGLPASVPTASQAHSNFLPQGQLQYSTALKALVI